MFRLPLRMAQDIIFEIKLDTQIENKRAHFVGKKLSCLFRCMRRERFVRRMRGIQRVAAAFLDECPFLAGQIVSNAVHHRTKIRKHLPRLICKSPRI